jgi:hypothetical protein
LAGIEDVNFPWAICMGREDAAALAAIRLIGGIEVAEAGKEIWLRGQRGDDLLDEKLSALPANARYEWLKPDQLRRIDQRVPAGRFPALQWQPLVAWSQVELPVAALPALEPRIVSLRLIRSGAEQEPELLLTDIAAFHKFASQAAQVRLERLQFAAAADGRVLVRGKPLPPLPGCRYVLHCGIAVPAGFCWEPAVSPEVLARRFVVSRDALVLWNKDGTITRLHGEQFIPVSRSAVRATHQAHAELR